MTTLGVDGGQSQVRLRICGESEILFVDGVTHFEGDTHTQLVDAVSRMWASAGGSDRHGPAESIALGLTTQPSDADDRLRLAAAIGGAISARRVRVTGDAVTAHYGALPDHHGVVLVVGTGVACLGVDAVTGVTRSVDGDGFLLGDRGGSFWMGSRGLGAVLSAADGRGAATSLSTASEEWFGSRGSLAAHVHSLDRPVNAIAQFAAEVQRHAAEGDAVAGAIVAAAARELVLSAEAAAQVVGGDTVPLAVSGRAASAGTALFGALTTELATRHRLSLQQPAGTPLDGACTLAEGRVPRAYESLVTEWRMANEPAIRS